MEHSDLSTLIATQQTALLRVGSPLHDKLALHSVAVHTFRGPASAGDETGFVSGVLVRMSRRCFLLSSREAARDAREGKVFLSVGGGDHPLILDVVSSAFDGGAGVIALTAAAGASLEAVGRAFLTERGLDAASPSRLAERNDWMVVGGFTALDLRGSRPDGRRAKIRGFSAELSRSAWDGEIEPRDLDLLLPERPLDARGGAATLDLSGAGCWQSGVHAGSGNWTPRLVRLVGIVENTRSEGRRARARVLSISRHLALAASLST